MIISLSILLLVASSVRAVLKPTPVADNDDVRTGDVPNSASCASAFIGDASGAKCIEVPQCSSQYYMRTVGNTETEAPVSLEPGRVVGTNSLQIVVQHAAVLDRVVKKITLSDKNADCNYPGKYWKKGTHANWAVTDNAADGSKVCRDTYISDIPWAQDCGMMRSENATHVTFLGKGLVTYEDPLGELDGIKLAPRVVSSVVQFSLSQPKVVRDISTVVRIIDEPRLLGAVTRQQFDLTTGNATLAVALSLAAPLRTTALISSDAPPGLTIVPVGDVDNTLCGNGKDAPCQQRYTFVIDPRALCQVDGTYTFSFAVDCHPLVKGTPDCPVAMTQAALNITVVLDGEDICAVVQGVLAVGGSITSHGEFTPASFLFGPVKNAFFQDQTLHFQVTVNSLNAFPFAASNILTVEAQDKAGVRTMLYNTATGGATEGWSFSFAKDPANTTPDKVAHRHQFSYLAAPDVFGDVERNKPIDSDVVVSVAVEFVNPVGPGGRKRAVVEHLFKRQATNTRTAEATTRIQVATPIAVATTAAAATVRPGSTAPLLTETEDINSAAVIMPSLAIVALATLL